jgi:hypothetical protein
VNDSNGILKKGIIHCFIATILIDTDNPPPTIRAANGSVYNAIYDDFIVPDSKNKIAKAIVSFQAWPDGNFAVIRNASPFISHSSSNRD